MKKITQTKSALCAFLACATMSVTAQNLNVQEKALKASEITVEKTIAFKGISATNTNWINFYSNNTASPVLNGIYVVEEGNSDGTINLKRKCDNQYIGRNGENITLVGDKMSATDLTVSCPALDEVEVTGTHDVTLPGWAVDQNYQIRFSTSDDYYLNVQGSGAVPKFKSSTGKGSWSIMMAYEVSESDYNTIGFAPYKVQVEYSEKGYVGALNKTDGQILKGFIEANNAESLRQAQEFMAQEHELITLTTDQAYRLVSVFQNDKHMVIQENKGTATPADSKNAAQIWTFAGNDTEGYTMSSQGAYLVAAQEQSAQATTTTDSEVASKFTLTPRANEIARFGLKPNKGFEIHFAGGNLLGWNGGNGSSWYILPVQNIEVTISQAGYATVNYPFAVQVPEDIKAYTGTASAQDGVFTLNEIADGIIPAHTPVILEGNADTYSLNILAANKTAAIASDLSGTYLSKAIDGAANAYILGNGSKGIGFYQMSDGNRTLGANKAYLELPASMSAIRSITIGGPTTGIEDTVAEGVAVEEYYDLQGRRVMNPVKGIYVTKSGKKVLFNK